MTRVRRLVPKRHDIYTVKVVREFFSRLLSPHGAHAAHRIQGKTILVDGLHDPVQRLSKALLDLVSSHRARKTVDLLLLLLKSVLAFLVALGRSGEHGETTTPDIYQDIFENVFHTSRPNISAQGGSSMLERDSQMRCQ